MSGLSKDSIDTVGKTIRPITTDSSGKRYALEGKIYINSNLTYNNGSTSSGTYYLKSVLMHELGHLLGLADSSFSDGIMYRYYTGKTSFYYTDFLAFDELY